MNLEVIEAKAKRKQRKMFHITREDLKKQIEDYLTSGGKITRIEQHAACSFDNSEHIDEWVREPENLGNYRDKTTLF